MKRSGEVEAKTKPSGSAKRNQNRGRSKATWACLSCRARKTRSNVALIGSPCYHCAQDDVCCVKPMSRRQKKVRARSEVSPSSYWPQNQPEQESPPSSSHSSTPTAQTQNPFEGEFGFAGDLQAILETHFCAVVPECPCEQFGLLACPFCDTENLSKDVIKGTSRL
ncbi:hypothetical protein DL95DRAFT_378022 [Leptodontidium sp. 2 PMI_412]|nr:hypothetical protein DL95DRAFT_378022 [Leptodontidium sp. 2 PMI_412]